MSEDTRYLGDGVYATFDGYQIYIWTSNGITESERIALEVHTMNLLIEYAKYCYNGEPAPKRAYGNMCPICRQWLTDGVEHNCPAYYTVSKGEKE